MTREEMIRQHHAIKEDVAISVVSHKLRLDGPRLQALYRWLVERMDLIRLPVNQIAGKGPKWPARYASYKHVRKRIEKTGFEALTNFSVRHLKPERHHPSWNNDFWDWSACGGASSEGDLGPRSHGLWFASWHVFLADAGLTDAQLLPHMLDFARLMVDEYGYVFFDRRKSLPSFHAAGFMISDESVRGCRAPWGDVFDQHYRYPVLRDVYPVNFLTRPYLDLDVAGNSLERWIGEDPARGTLAPLNDKVTVWTPPVAMIPQIRESLFPTGALTSARYNDLTYRRDYSRPFVPPDPTPVMYRAEYYRDRDPGMLE